MQKSHLLFFISAAILGNVVFKVGQLDNGFNLEKPKPKHAVKDFGEDSTSATPLGLALADGVSKCLFSSKFLSQSLVNTAASLHNNPTEAFKNTRFSDKDYRKVLLDRINLSLRGFWQAILGEYDGYLNVGDMTENDFPLDNFGTSSTLVSAIIDDTTVKDNLKIFQKGDSLIAIFRLVPSEAAGTFHYQLQFLSPELQEKFGKPFQFIGIGDVPPNFKDDAVFTDTVKDGDIVLLGSDGLFDNVHSSVLVFCLNYVGKRIIEGTLAGEDPKLVFDDLGDMLLEKLTNESTDIQDSADTNYTPQGFAELMARIANGNLQLVDSQIYTKSTKNKNAMLMSKAVGFNPSVFQSRSSWNNQFEINEEDETLEGTKNGIDLDLDHDVPTEYVHKNEPANYKTFNPKNENKLNMASPNFQIQPNKQAKLKKFTQKPAGEDFNNHLEIQSPDRSKFKSQVLQSRPGLLVSMRPSLHGNMGVPNLATSNVFKTPSKRHMNVAAGHPHPKPVNHEYDPTVHIYDDSLDNKNDVEAFIGHIDGRDIIYQQTGKNSEWPLVSGRVEVFMSRRYSFKLEQIAKFKREYDMNSFAQAVAHLAHKLSYAKQWYPAPYWLNALKSGAKDPGAYGKPDDISLIPALVITKSEKIKLMTLIDGYKQIAGSEEKNIKDLSNSVWSFMSYGVPEASAAHDDERIRRRLGKVQNIRI